MSNYSDQYGSSREYYNNKEYARGTNNTTNTNTSGNNTSYSAYTADSNNTGAYSIPQVPATTPQLDLTQVASLIAQSPQALSLLLALQQVQQLGPQSTAAVVPASSASYPSSSTGYNSSGSGYNESSRTRSHGSDYYSGRGGESSDRSDRRGRDDRTSSGGHTGRRDREQYSSRRGGPPEKRDGDWICGKSDCNNLNFSWRTECHLCHAPRDQSAARDQSAGQGSESRDYSDAYSQSRDQYNQRSSEGRDYINYERPPYRATDTRHSTEDLRRRGADWHCPDLKCGHFNFSKRDRCQRCNAARPSDHSTDVPRDQGTSGSSGNYPSGGPGYSDRRRERRDRPY